MVVSYENGNAPARSSPLQVKYPYFHQPFCISCGSKKSSYEKLLQEHEIHRDGLMDLTLRCGGTGSHLSGGSTCFNQHPAVVSVLPMTARAFRLLRHIRGPLQSCRCLKLLSNQAFPACTYGIYLGGTSAFITMKLTSWFGTYSSLL